jgi:uncharacterized protein YbaA (DUF1428 family)
VQAAGNETIVFSWMAWASRQARAEGNAKVVAHPDLAEIMKDMPVDGKRMSWGGFEPMVALGSTAS